MENHLDSVHALFERAGDYLETRVELYKLQAVNKSSQVFSSLASRLIITIILIFFITLLNIGVALWIGECLGKMYYGFFIMAAFYGLVALIVYALRRTLLQKPVINSLIKKMMN
ncbi:MAG: phage holin family protein [Ferruginibacter sp.]